MLTWLYRVLLDLILRKIRIKSSLKHPNNDNSCICLMIHTDVSNCLTYDYYPGHSPMCNPHPSGEHSSMSHRHTLHMLLKFKHSNNLCIQIIQHGTYYSYLQFSLNRCCLSHLTGLCWSTL